VWLLAHDAARFPPQPAVDAWVAAARKGAGKAAASGAGGSKAAAASAGAGAAGAEGPAPAAGGEYGPLAAQAACLSFLADCLLGSWTSLLAASAGGAVASVTAAATSQQSRSLSLLLTLLGVRLRDVGDAVAPARTPALHAVSELAYQLLRRYGKEPAAFAPHGGDIRFPVALFRSLPRASGSAAPSGSGSGSASSSASGKHSAGRGSAGRPAGGAAVAATPAPRSGSAATYSGKPAPAPLQTPAPSGAGGARRR
jgi:hypothetical protein